MSGGGGLDGVGPLHSQINPPPPSGPMKIINSGRTTKDGVTQVN